MSQVLCALIHRELEPSGLRGQRGDLRLRGKGAHRNLRVNGEKGHFGKFSSEGGTVLKTAAKKSPTIIKAVTVMT